MSVAVGRGRWRGRAGRPRRGAAPNHVLDGPDGGDGVLGEGKRHGHGAHQFAIDVNRAAAHPLHHPGMFQRAAGKPRQDERLLWARRYRARPGFRPGTHRRGCRRRPSCPRRACRAGCPSRGRRRSAPKGRRPERGPLEGENEAHNYCTCGGGANIGTTAYQATRFHSRTKSKRLSRLGSGRACRRAGAAVQTSFAGMRRPAQLPCSAFDANSRRGIPCVAAADLACLKSAPGVSRTVFIRRHHPVFMGYRSSPLSSGSVALRLSFWKKVALLGAGMAANVRGVLERS